MLNAGVLKFSASGRVLCTGLGTPVVFSGGVPLSIDGEVCVSPATPDLYIAGIGYRTSDRLCGNIESPSGEQGGIFARDSNGGLALADIDPIVGYYAGIPYVADGRIAVEFSTPIVPSAFSFAYDSLAFG